MTWGRLGWSAFGAMVLAPWACGDGDGDGDGEPPVPVCEPGRVTSCTCVGSGGDGGATYGVRTCLSDGTGWGPCVDCSPGGFGGQGGSGGQSPTGGGGGTAGSGGDAGMGGNVGGAAGAGGAASLCDISGGPAMVEVPNPLGGTFCIDATEVTKAHYAGWLATTPPTANQPAYCQWNGDFTPTAEWPAAPGTENQPIAWADWCDAYAYCAGVGKRLCGHLSGGATPWASHADPLVDQWFGVCSCYSVSNYAYAYPYGDTYEPTTCNGNDNGASFDMLDVGTQPNCHCPFPEYAAIYDMSGNAYEWQDSCDGSTGASDTCRVRGGGTNEGSSGLRCNWDHPGFARSFTNDLVAFRCCYP